MKKLFQKIFLLAFGSILLFIATYSLEIVMESIYGSSYRYSDNFFASVYAAFGIPLWGCTVVAMGTILFSSEATQIYDPIEKSFDSEKPSKSRKYMAFFIGSLFGFLTKALINYIFYDAPFQYGIVALIVTYITTRITLESERDFSDIKIKSGKFFKSKAWLILQVIWVVLVIMTAKYHQNYPQYVWLFYSFVGRDFMTSGLIQIIVMALPFSTNLYYWIKR